jgi:hypothetical protein
MKRWLLCCCSYSNDHETKSARKSQETGSAENISHYANSDSITIDSPRQFQHKLDLVKRELQRTERYRNQPITKRKPCKIVSTESLPVYQECDGKLVSLGMSKTVVFTDN